MLLEQITINVDYKNLVLIKNALENEISYLNDINFGGTEKENIQEHKELLKKINTHISKLEK